MSQVLAITDIGRLVTMAGPPGPRRGAAMRELGVVADAAVLCVDGAITAAGPSAQVAPLIPPDAVRVSAEGRLVTPGLVDAHTHLVFAGSRADEFARRAEGQTYQEIAAAGGGIRRTVALTRAASDEALSAQARRHLQWMISSGTTTLEAKSGYGLDAEQELRILRTIAGLSGPTIVPTFLGLHAVPPEYAGRREAYVDNVLDEVLPLCAPHARYVDAFIEANYFTPDDARRLAARAREFRLGLRLHVDQLTLRGGAELAAELGADTADHLEQTDAAGIAALARAGVTPVLLPGSVYALGLNRYPDARTMIDAGLPVVLATDFNPGSSPTPSLPMVMSLAATQMRVTPAEALTASTVNAAASLGFVDRGVVAPGSRADLVVWDVAEPEELATWFGVSLARTVIIQGAVAWSSDRPE